MRIFCQLKPHAHASWPSKLERACPSKTCGRSGHSTGCHCDVGGGIFPLSTSTLERTPVDEPRSLLSVQVAACSGRRRAPRRCTGPGTLARSPSQVLPADELALLPSVTFSRVGDPDSVSLVPNNVRNRNVEVILRYALPFPHKI